MHITQYIKECIFLYNPFYLNGKLILVTGASSGIGLSTAIELSKLGARLILVGRSIENLQETYERLYNKHVHFIEQFDLSEIELIPSWMNELAKKTGEPLDGFVHSAGVYQITPLKSLNNNQLIKILNINLNAGLQILRCCCKKNVAKAGSSFVFLSSISGIFGEAGLVAYSASKGAIISAVKTAAVELAPNKMRVNCIIPGLIDTNMSQNIRNQIGEGNFNEIVKKHPLGMGAPEDVAHAAIYLLSDASRWVTGTSIVVDGGYSC